MKGRIVLITGSTDGIGKATALGLARKGATVVIHGRTVERCSVVRDELRKASRSEHIDYFAADLASLKEIRELAMSVKEKYSKLHVLINNAGVYMADRQESEDGLEMTFAVNHLAPFLLTHLLLDLLRKGAPSRIITVSSIAHTRGRIDLNNLQFEKKFDGYNAYALSKLANLLFTFELAERLRGVGITVNSLHPGVTNTKLLSTGFPNLQGSPLSEGAETPVYLASSPAVQDVTGKYFVKKREQPPSPHARDIKLRKEFWKASEQLAGIKSAHFGL